MKKMEFRNFRNPEICHSFHFNPDSGISDRFEFTYLATLFENSSAP